MQVRDVMRTSPHTVDEHASVLVAAERMKTEDAGCLVVCNDDDLQGIVTDRDISMRCIAEGKNPSSTPVRDIMSVGVVECHAHETIGEVIERMMDHGVMRLPVLDQDRHLVGMISARDSVRSVPMAKLAQRKPHKVRFVREIPSHQGQVHDVPVRNVYVTDAADHEDAKAQAIKRFESERGEQEWEREASRVEVEVPA